MVIKVDFYCTLFVFRNDKKVQKSYKLKIKLKQFINMKKHGAA